jgi:hypothetical protein
MRTTMNHRLAAAAISLMLAVPAVAADSPYVLADYSTPTLIEKATVDAIWHANLPEARLARLYAPRKWGFLSQVVGGLVSGQTCVVTARAVMLPRTTPTRRLVWEPAKSSTTFDSRPNATAAQCSELAAEKLKEAVQSLASSLVKT